MIFHFLRWFLRATGRHHTLFADILEWVFMLSFGVVRLGIGTALLWSYYQQDTDWFGRLGGTALYIISVMFFINICSYAVRKYTKRYKKWVEQKNSGSISQMQDENDKNDVSDVGIVKDQEIPSQREIKTSVSGELTVRKNCKVHQTPD